ncbi:hypothetical protein ACW9YV_20155 (plasmid) [Paraburkholderia strydomiana]
MELLAMELLAMELLAMELLAMELLAISLRTWLRTIWDCAERLFRPTCAVDESTSWDHVRDGHMHCEHVTPPCSQ